MSQVMLRNAGGQKSRIHEGQQANEYILVLQTYKYI
jgi:hypothetical protein